MEGDMETLPNTYTIQRKGRAWALHDQDGILVCLTLYRRGALEVVRRLVAAGELTRHNGHMQTAPQPCTP